MKEMMNSRLLNSKFYKGNNRDTIRMFLGDSTGSPDESFLDILERFYDRKR